MSYFRKLIVILVILFLISGCATTKPTDTETPKPSEEASDVYENVEDTIIDTEISENNINNDDILNEQQVTNDTLEQGISLNETQMNSILMLNYISCVTEGIINAPNNRLVLTDTYNNLKNNLNPNSVDENTQQQVKNLMRTINSLEMNNTQRDRIQYLYDQGKADAMRNAIPSPMAILNVMQAQSPLKAIVAVTAMALNSYDGYKDAVSNAEIQFLQSNWQIQDNEKKYLDNIKIEAFDYLMDIVRENSLPGELSLNTDSVKYFMEKKNSDNYDRNLQFLETNEETYQAYYEYWLFLADTYYWTNNYEKCIDAFDSFEELNVNIFRKNLSLAKTLPSVICSAQEIFKGDELINREEKYVQMLMDNAPIDEWSLHYFAIQTLLDLYARTKDEQYLQKAYTQSLSVVDSLIDTQTKKNNEYMTDLALLNEKDGTEIDKKNAKEYNKILKSNRETELPPVYEPLLINCQLLFAIADELNISQAEKERIDRILHSDGNKLFLSDSLDNIFWMSKDIEYSYDVSIEKGITSTKVLVLANVFSDSSSITVEHNGTIYDKWTIKEVNRNKSKDINDFVIEFNNDEFSKATLKDGDEVKIRLTPCEGEDSKEITFLVEKSLFSTKFVKK